MSDCPNCCPNCAKWQKEASRLRAALIKLDCLITCHEPPKIGDALDVLAAALGRPENEERT